MNSITNSNSANYVEMELTKGVGTAFYRAPEMENISSYGSSSGIFFYLYLDMYSFGIILFEMFYSF